jgi:hypothetical protein
MRLAELVGSSGSSANDREEIGFAKDSPLEGRGFEPSVPLGPPRPVTSAALCRVFPVGVSARRCFQFIGA